MLTRNMISMIFLLTISLFIYGCASQDIKYEPSVSTAEAKSIFVFMDGTGNMEKVPTNVFQLFDAIRQFNDNKTLAIYIQGVGNANDSIGELAGQAAGFGKKEWGQVSHSNMSLTNRSSRPGGEKHGVRSNIPT